MKKKIVGLAVIITITLAGWNFNKNSEVKLSDLALENTEALASGESDLCPNGCLSNGSGCYCNGWYPSYREA